MCFESLRMAKHYSKHIGVYCERRTCVEAWNNFFEPSHNFEREWSSHLCRALCRAPTYSMVFFLTSQPLSFTRLSRLRCEGRNLRSQFQVWRCSKRCGKLIRALFIQGTYAGLCNVFPSFPSSHRYRLMPTNLELEMLMNYITEPSIFLLWFFLHISYGQFKTCYEPDGTVSDGFPCDPEAEVSSSAFIDPWFTWIE